MKEGYAHSLVVLVADKSENVPFTWVHFTLFDEIVQWCGGFQSPPQDLLEVLFIVKVLPNFFLTSNDELFECSEKASPQMDDPFFQFLSDNNLVTLFFCWGTSSRSDPTLEGLLLLIPILLKLVI